MPALVGALRTAPPAAHFGLAVIALYVGVAAFAPLLAPFGERQVVGPEFAPWSATHWLGTDNLGRDMLTRLIYGARNMLAIASATTALAFGLGSALGLLAGTVGGLVDRILAWTVDILMAMPSLILALLLLTIFGTSIPVMIGVIALLEATRVFRLARAVSLGIVVLDYVDAARLRGEGLTWLVLREVLPNAAPPLVAEFGLRFFAALSFLGLGIKPPTAEWGSMVRDNASLITFGDVTPLLPAAAIALLTVAVNFVVDWILHRASGLKD
jgi:peptide/nickel transport system permease protein